MQRAKGPEWPEIRRNSLGERIWPNQETKDMDARMRRGFGPVDSNTKPRRFKRKKK